MATPTVGELLQEYELRKKEIRVWGYLKDALDRTMKLNRSDPGAAVIRMEDGRVVEDDVMIRVLAELDGLISELDDQAASILTKTVGGG